MGPLMLADLAEQEKIAVTTLCFPLPHVNSGFYHITTHLSRQPETLVVSIHK
jgi:hypothetical protein